jgi:hypothetical protein
MLTLAELKAKVPTTVLSTGDTIAIATVVSVGRVKTISYQGGIGTIMQALGPTLGAALLDQLDALTTTVPAVKWGMKLINAGTFDFGLPSSQGMIDQLVLDPTMNAALKAVATIPDPVTEYEVRCALYDPIDGHFLG